MTRIRHFLFAALIGILCFPMRGEAEERIQFFAYLLEERLSDEKYLGYNKYLDFILQDLNEQVAIEIAPLRRNSEKFFQSPGACAFPANELPLRAGRDLPDITLISSEPVDLVSARIYTHKDKPIISSPDQLKGKRIGHLLGSAAQRILNKKGKFNFKGVRTEELLIKMLENGRIDAMLAFHPDLQIQIDRIGGSPVHFSRDYAVFKVATHVLCYDTEKNRNFLDTVNKRIVEAHETGLAQQFLGPFAITVKPTIGSSKEH